MPVKFPYHRSYRQFEDGKYDEGGRSNYINHPSYALSPDKYIRAFKLIQKDLLELFDYVEPSDNNLLCFSYRIHALFMRACIEFEANCKAILKENNYKKDQCNISDYFKIDKTHLLSKYQVRVPYWIGEKDLRHPFQAWGNKDTKLPWYKAYNDSKHDRHGQFQKASFENLLDACCGVLVILSSQFGTNDFSSGPTLFECEGSRDGMESAIGGYFRIMFPDDYPLDLRYNFDWMALKDNENPFQKYNYS